MEAEDVFFKYDLTKNKMEFKSLFFDERNFIFPEYDLSTSLSNAVVNKKRKHRGQC